MDGLWPPGPDGPDDPRLRARLVRAVGSAGHGMALCAPDGLIQWVNPQFVALTGYQPSQALGRHLIDLLDCMDEARAPVILARERIAAGQGFRVEMLMRAKDDRRFWGDLDVRPVAPSGPIDEGFVAILVEARSTAMDNSALATPSAVRTAANLARVGAWNIDLRTNTVRWGGEFKRLLGRPRQIEPLADTLNLYPAEEAQRVREVIQHSIRTGQQFEFESRALTGDGQELWLRVIGEPHFEDGRCVAIHGASQDITRQREALAELREQQRFAQGVVDGVPALLTVIDEDGAIITANKAFKSKGAALLGTSDYPMGRSLFTVLMRLPRGHGRALERGLRGVLAGRTEAFSRSYQSQDGEWFRMSASRFPGDGPVRCVVITQSIEKLKRSDRRLRQLNQTLKAAREQADAANAAKSQFLATMSHEIRTPLNGVLGMAQAMEHDDLPDHQRERLTVIRQAGESLLALLNDLLDLSRIEAGRLGLEDAVIDVGEIARGVHATFAPLAADKGLSFVIQVDPEAEGAWRGDPMRVRQILSNLTSNAIKFTAAGTVSIEIDHRLDGLALAVRDSGPGIPAHQQQALFEKFVQADASTTRRHGGSGLGLSICRELAQLMNGDVSVESREGYGACFTARLPLARSAGRGRARGAAPPPAARRPERLRILAADDNAMNRLVIRTLLDQAGIEVEVVSDGAEAIAAWAGGTWDAILMDVQMPGMDGVTATRAIREQEIAQGRARIPIVALTANAMSHHEAEYIEAGMDALSPKPIEIERLFETLSTLLAP